MRLVCKHNTCRIYAIIKDNQVVPNKNTSKMLPRRERMRGKERTGRQQPLYISERIQMIIATILISIGTLNVSVGSYI
jgi:hypothetical protein